MRLYSSAEAKRGSIGVSQTTFSIVKFTRNTLALDRLSIYFWKIILLQLFNHRSCVRLKTFKSSTNTVFNYLIGDVQPYDPSFFANT